MKFDSEEERKSVEVLVHVAQQVWDRQSYSLGEWDELSDALRIVSPIVIPDFDIEEFLGG